MKSIKVYCPGSVANLSCGFDILGLCLDNVGDEMTVSIINKPVLKLDFCDGYKVTSDIKKNAATVSANALLKSYKKLDFGFNISINKKIKPGSGIGSSAASSAGSVFAINKLLGEPFSKMELIKFASEGEFACTQSYHADNISAVLLGGITLVRDNTNLDIVRLNTPIELFVSIIHPQIEIKTSDSRAIIGRRVEISKLTEQASNLGALISALYTADYELNSRSINDIIAEPYRSELIPEFNNLKQFALENGSIGFGISGSGPWMFSLSKGPENANKVKRKLEDYLNIKNIDFKSYVSAVNDEGVKII